MAAFLWLVAASLKCLRLTLRRACGLRWGLWGMTERYSLGEDARELSVCLIRSFMGLSLLPRWLHRLDLEENNYILRSVWHERWEGLFALAYGILEEWRCPSNLAFLTRYTCSNFFPAGLSNRLKYYASFHSFWAESNYFSFFKKVELFLLDWE